MNEMDFMKSRCNPLDFFRSLKFDISFFRSNPDYFEPDGIWVFCGKQGSGKTLSAVRTVKALAVAYPKAMICSNLDIHGLDRDIIPFTDYSQISTLSNGGEGIIFLIDEIHVLWNSLESKEIPISEMATFAQMRKERRLIVGTSQVYNRIAKPIREQLKYIIMCRNILKYIQINTVIDPMPDGFTLHDNDGDVSGQIIHKQFFIHSPQDYASYDTLNKIQRFTRKREVKKYV